MKIKPRNLKNLKIPKIPKIPKLPKFPEIPKIHIDIDEIYKKYRLKFFAFSVIFLLVSVTLLYINRAQSYTKYERVQFISAGSKLYANLYYPSKTLSFQNKRPLVIYVHGMGSRRDLDIRALIELTKRGFFVASIDYQAHGESGGSIFDIDKDTDTPALAQACSLLLDKIENLDIYKEKINPDQVGLLGHSLGGLIVLLNGALDNRFNVTVTWAGLVDADMSKLEDISEEDKKIYEKFHPKKLLDENHPKNLLVIQHVNDEILPYEKNAKYAHELTDCKLVTITEPLIGGAHNLHSDKVLIETINWFEDVFFGSKYKNGAIQITYRLNYLLLYMSIVALFMTVLSIMLYCSKYFSIKKSFKDSKDVNKNEPISKLELKKQKRKIAKYIFIFISIWGISVLIFGLFGLIIAPIVIILIYFIVKLKIHLQKPKNEREFCLKESIKSQFELNAFLYSVFCTIVLISSYAVFTSTYPFGFFIPSSIIFFLLALTVYPWYLAFEIFYRKVIYPELYYIKSPIKKIGIVSGYAILTQFILMALTIPYSIIEPVLITFMVSLAVIIINSIIYEKTGNFIAVILSSFLIIQIFSGTAITTVLGINSVIQIMFD